MITRADIDGIDSSASSREYAHAGRCRRAGNGGPRPTAEQPDRLRRLLRNTARGRASEEHDPREPISAVLVGAILRIRLR